MEIDITEMKLYVKEERNEKEDFLNDVSTSQYDAIDEKHSVKEEQNRSKNFSIEGNSDLLKNKLNTLKIPVIKLAKLYWCNKCQKNFKTDQSLRIHTKAHMEKSTQTDPSDFTTTSCTSPTCKIAFTKFAREVSRMPVGPYECKVCKQTFSVWQNLWKHMRIHEKKESYACNICSENFMNNDLDNHFRTKCLGEKIHNCKICGKGFFEISWLNRHMVNHTEEKRFECDICGKIFAGITGLKYHQKTKENPYLKCGICNKKVCHRKTLSAHQNSHFYPSRTNEVLKMLNQQTIFKSAPFETYEKKTISSSSKGEMDFQPLNLQRGYQTSLSAHEKADFYYNPPDTNEVQKNMYQQIISAPLEKKNMSSSSKDEVDFQPINFQWDHQTTLSAHEKAYFYYNLTDTNEVQKNMYQQIISAPVEKKNMSSSSKDEVDFQPINFQRGSLKTYERKKNFREKIQNNEIVSIVKIEPESDVQDKEEINFVKEYQELGKMTENDNSISCSLKEESRDSLNVTLSPNAKEDSWNDVITSGPHQYDSLDEKHSLKKEPNHRTNSSMKGSDLPTNTLKIPIIKLAKLYWCNKCHKNFKTDQSLKIHTEAHTCKMVFTKFANVIAHMLRHKRYECDVCKTIFSAKQNLRTHMRIHKKKEPYACDICSKEFTDKSNLIEHLRHMVQKDSICQKFQSSTKVHILRNKKNCLHQERDRKNHKNHVCSICWKRVSTKSNLKIHKLIHLKEKAYECEICGKSFVDKYKLQKHRISRSKRNPYFECDICQLKLCHKRTLVLHKSIHYKPTSQPTPLIKEEVDLQAAENGNSILSSVIEESRDPLNSTFSVNTLEDPSNDLSKIQSKPLNDSVVEKKNLEEDPMKLVNLSNKDNKEVPKKIRKSWQQAACEICHKKFTRMGNLRQHKIIHMCKKPFECKNCGKGFIRQDRMIKHMSYRHGIHVEKYPIKSFVCDVCSKRLSNISSLRIHKMIHLDKKPFECETCGKEFISRYRLTSHMQVHLGVRRHECDICNKTFFERNTLMRHILAAHRNIKRYTCDDCQKCYRRKSELHYHKCKYSDKKQHVCKMCGKSFLRRFLERHLCYLAGDQHFECDFCKKKFTSHFSMKQHINWHMRVIENEIVKPKFVTVHFLNHERRRFLSDDYRFDHTYSKLRILYQPASVMEGQDEKDPLNLDEDIQIKYEKQVPEIN